MYKILFKLCIIFSFISPCIMSNGRKYDVETEALKLYGEDFKSVLRRFRKTPDYLKILTDKMNDLKVYVKEMSLQVLHYYHGKMTQRVNDIIGITRGFDDSPTTPALLYYHAYGNRRQEAPHEEETKEGVKILDNYKVFNYALSVAERNSFKDLGFEFAGNLIHAIIHNMGPVDTPPKSTRLPFGGQESDKSVPTTTEHPHTHEVTPESTLAEIAHSADDQTTTESFRFRMDPEKPGKID